MTKENNLNLPTEKIKSLRLILPYKLFKILKVKKKIHKTNYSKNQEDDISKIQNDLKNSIKNLYISDEKKRKQLTNMRNSLQKLGTNMQNYNKKIIN